MALVVVITALGVIGVAPPLSASEGRIAPALGMQSPAVVTCTIQSEEATGNSRTEVQYYECLALNKAIVPSVTFIVYGQSSGDLWLRQLAGRTVDVRLEVVR